MAQPDKSDSAADAQKKYLIIARPQRVLQLFRQYALQEK
jgi:hypothetical protein